MAKLSVEQNVKLDEGYQMPVNEISSLKPVLVYTMTAGLGDVVVLDSLVNNVEYGISGSICQIFHRNNPHTRLWSESCSSNRYTNVFSFQELSASILRLRRYCAEGRTVFGLQMAPGSIQGFLFLYFLKKIGALDLIVDFNLVNADIITPPRGKYIFNLHMNQAADLLGVNLSEKALKPSLPFMKNHSLQRKSNTEIVVGIHPWSRRGHLKAFMWQAANWLEVIRYLVQRHCNLRIVIIGKDDSFNAFRTLVEGTEEAASVSFEPSSSVPHLASTIDSLDLLITVNTGAVHIGHALGTPMVILSGPSLDLWIPESETIVSVTDKTALFQSADRSMDDSRFSMVSNIPVSDVITSLDKILPLIVERRPILNAGISQL